MNDGTNNPRWIIVAGTVSAFSMFLPDVHDVRHAAPDSQTTHDCRFGYGLALGWSLLISIVVATDADPKAAMMVWLVSSAIMVAIYEWFIFTQVGAPTE